MSDATMVTNKVKEDVIEAEEEMFKDVVNADLIWDATIRDVEERH
jgi:hypothetical protein